MTKTVGVLGSLAVLSLMSCATFDSHVGGPQSREYVAGTTMTCAANSQSRAIWGAVSAVGLSAVSSSFSVAAASQPGTPAAYTNQAFSIGFGVGAVVMAVLSAFQLGHSVSYLGRAGEVLSGASNDGCDQTALPHPADHQPVTETRDPVITVPAVESAPTKQCTGGQIDEMKRSGVSESAIRSACGTN